MNEKIDYEIKLLLSKKINESEVIKLFYNIGKILNHNKITYYELSILDGFFRNKYGLIISLSKKNLVRILKFYQKCKNINIDILKKIDWNSYLILINKKNYEQLINIYIDNNMNKRELEHYIKTGKIINIAMKYRDPATEEFIKLQIRLNKRDI